MSKKNLSIFVIILVIVIIVWGFYSYRRTSQPIINPAIKTSSKNIATNSEQLTATNSEQLTATNSEQLTIGPIIKISPTSFNLGTVIYGDIARRVFKITNLGNETLKIARLATSCGCTSASIADQDRTIAPGETVNMPIAFNPAVHKNDSDLGNITRVIYIKSNDLQKPETSVKIYAKVIKLSQK